jgi:hypothetical protein
MAEEEAAPEGSSEDVPVSAPGTGGAGTPGKAGPGADTQAAHEPDAEARTEPTAEAGTTAEADTDTDEPIAGNPRADEHLARRPAAGRPGAGGPSTVASPSAEPPTVESGGSRTSTGEPDGGRDDFGPAARPPRWWAKPLLVSVTALAAMAVLTLATIVQSPHAKAGTDAGPAAETTPPRTAAPSPPAPSPAPTAPAATAAAPTGTPLPSPAPPAPAESAARSVRRAVDALPGNGDLAVAVTDVDRGSAGGTVAYDTSDDDGNTYDTASIVKVDILAALLLQEQRAGRHLTSYQRGLATEMIESSDNDAATALWDTIGGASGLATANAALGLHHTTGGPGDLWGLTQTTAGDQLRLLRAVFGDDGSPLSAGSRSYLRDLMGAIDSGQRWGVSAADSDDAGYALKNGWLQRSATGLWDVNSIGEVTYAGHRLLIAVLSSGQRSEQGGIDLVEDAALAVAKAFTATG